MSINPGQLREYVIRPVLYDLFTLANIPHTDYMEALLLATAAQETHAGAYVRQIKGPACGIYQMEPNTVADLMGNYVFGQMGRYGPLFKKYMAGENLKFADITLQLTWNMGLATLLARLYYFRVPEKQPSETTPDTLWHYYKTYWNTHLGAATEQQFQANLKSYSDVETN